MEMLLKSFLIDVVQPVEVSVEDDESPSGWGTKSQVQMITFKVLAQSPEHAFKRFTQEEGGVIVYQGEVVDRILVGMNLDQKGIYDVS